MGRKPKPGLTYFPLDTDFFYADDKIDALVSAHGAIGLATYINILCRVYAAGYYCKIKDVESLARSIAKDIMSDRDQLRHMTTKVYECLHYMAELNLIDRGLFEMNVISSLAIQRQFMESMRKLKRNTKIDSYNLVGVDVSIPENGISSEEMGISSEEMGVNSEESAQSKVKENNITTTTTVPACVPKKRAVENRGGPVGNSVEPPSWTEVYLYMRSYTDIDPADVSAEADAFMARNAVYKWKCLPDWKAAVELWAARIKCPRN